jgi:hypothetical protein
MIVKLTLCTALLTASVAAQASNWQDIGSNANTQLAIDVGSLQANGYNVTVWQRFTYSTPVQQTAVPGLVSINLAQWTYDCAQRRQALGSYSAYDKSGAVLVTQTVPVPTWAPVAPDTAGELVFQSVCKVK